MIAVSMGDENMRHRLATHGVEQRTDMRRVIGARIDDCDFAAPENIAHGPFEGERTRIVGHDAPHALHRLVNRIRRKFEVFVEGDVVVHMSSGALAEPAYHYFGLTCTLAIGR